MSALLTHKPLSFAALSSSPFRGAKAAAPQREAKSLPYEAQKILAYTIQRRTLPQLRRLKMLSQTDAASGAIFFTTSLVLAG